MQDACDWATGWFCTFSFSPLSLHLHSSSIPRHLKLVKGICSKNLLVVECCPNYWDSHSIMKKLFCILPLIKESILYNFWGVFLSKLWYLFYVDLIAHNPHPPFSLLFPSFKGHPSHPPTLQIEEEPKVPPGERRKRCLNVVFLKIQRAQSGGSL